jgi:hypothetical protein
VPQAGAPLDQDMPSLTWLAHEEQVHMRQPHSNQRPESDVMSPGLAHQTVGKVASCAGRAVAPIQLLSNHGMD